MEVNRKAKRATQFWVSAIVKVPMGGKKKKLKQSAAKIDIGIAYRNPHNAETTRIASKKLSATVVGLECTYLE